MKYPWQTDGSNITEIHCVNAKIIGHDYKGWLCKLYDELFGTIQGNFSDKWLNQGGILNPEVGLRFSLVTYWEGTKKTIEPWPTSSLLHITLQKLDDAKIAYPSEALV